jgi:hypothetical protein
MTIVLVDGVPQLRRHLAMVLIDAHGVLGSVKPYAHLNQSYQLSEIRGK